MTMTDNSIRTPLPSPLSRRDQYFVETLAARYEGPIFTLEAEDGTVQLVTPVNMRMKKEADAISESVKAVGLLPRKN